jgi:hypothetical protein
MYPSTIIKTYIKEYTLNMENEREGGEELS